MVRRETVNVIPDYNGPDGWKRSPLESPFHVPALEEIGLAVDVAAAAVHLINIAGKDQLRIPQEYRNKNRTPEQTTEVITNLAQLLGRRFDPLYNLVKLRIHKWQESNEAAEVAKFAGAVIPLSETGVVSNPIGAAVATLLVDRAVIHRARGEVASDKEGDEEKRLGDAWDIPLWDQVEQVARQAHLNKDETERLRAAAFQEVVARHSAFHEQFTEQAPDGRYRTTSQLDEAIQAGVKYFKLTDGLERLVLRRHPWRYLTRRDEAWDLKQQFVTYESETQRYMTMEELQKWIASENAYHPTRRRRLVDKTSTLF